MAGTIVGVLAEVAERDRGALVFHEDSGSTERLTATALLEHAEGAASFLRGRGVSPGDAVGLLGPNDAEWARWAFGIWACGATLVPIQFPLRVRDPGALAEQVASLLGGVPCRIVVAHPGLMDVLPDGLGVAWDARANGRAGPPAAGEPNDVAVAQFTSGTTGAPKAAVITNGAVVAAIEATAAAYGVTEDDVFAGWQPFFHDLGLFGLLLRPLLLGLEAHFISTARFARDPAEWLRLAGRSGATMLAGPSSAWAAATRAASRDASGCDLGSIRMATFSAETVDRRAVEDLMAVGGGLGLRPEALSAAYGMAETTLAVTVTRPGAGLRFDEVGLVELAEHGRAAPADGGAVRSVASCGVAVPGAEVRILDPAGDEMPERSVGRVVARAPYLFSGYRSADGDEVFTPDGWLRTGDLGYLAEGELFFTGRQKDVIVVLGRNHDPDDLEWAAGRVPGVRTGRCVALSMPAAGEGSVTVVVEPREGADVGELPILVRRGVIDAIGVVPTEVLVVAAGTVPKTTSGKVRRSALRQAILEGTVPVIGMWPRPR
ncbi:MAG: AMP-binding protein [Actinomycetota bacterium]